MASGGRSVMAYQLKSGIGVLERRNQLKAGGEENGKCHGGVSAAAAESSG